MDILDQGLSAEARKNLYMGSELLMMWHCKADPRFSYHTYIPEGAVSCTEKKYRVMSFVHGTGRTIEEYRELFKDFAERNNLVLIFPMFPGGLKGDDDFNSYKLLAYDEIRYDDIFLKMVDELAERFPVIDTEKIFLYGWSGGGHFVHRFLYTHPERLAAVMPGAPGRPTYIDDTLDFYWGTRNFEEIFGEPLDLQAMRKVPVRLLIGELDTKYVGESPYGTTRMERIRNLEKNYKEHGLNVSLEIIPGIGHKGNDAVKSRYVMRFFQEVIDGESRLSEENAKNINS